MKKFLSILMVVVMASFFLVGCLPTPNVGPVFTSTAGSTATVGTAYSYTPTATDADADTVTFSVAGPTGMAISAGVITWTPATADIGAHSVIVTASDGTNATAQTFTLTVSAAVVPVPVGAIIDIAGIIGVTAPVTDNAPVAAITASAQYTGVVTWSPAATTFATGTVYTATITLTPKAGFTLTGVAANFFTVVGATSDTNPINSGVVTAVFAATTPVATISITAIAGVPAPVTGLAPDLVVTPTAQFTGAVTWKTAAGGAVGATFAAGTAYTATITLTPTAGFTLTGVPANFFRVGTLGAGTETNPINSGVVTAYFVATTAAPTVLSAAFTDSGTITIVYSAPVITAVGDYTFPATITGPVAGTFAPTGAAITAVAGAGTTWVVAIPVLGIPVITADSTGTIAIAATVVLTAEPTNPLVAVTQAVLSGF